MAIDMAATRTRRGILAGAFGGLAAWAASALGHAVPVEAANGGNVILGQTNTATKATAIATTGTESAIEGRATSGTGVLGVSTNGTAITGESQSAAGPAAWFRSQGNSTAVFGWSQTVGVEFGIQLPAKTGVFGRAIQDATAVGVRGESAAGRGVQGSATSGFGVRASATSGMGVYASTSSGTGVYSVAAAGYALRTSGRVKMDRVSGVAAITAGHTSVTVSPGLDIPASGAFVLLTPRSDLGGRRLWYTIDTTANTITIRVSSAVTGTVGIGWLLLG